LAASAPKLPADAKALVAGLPFAVKDNIAVKDWLLRCGSKHLAEFRSPYTATAVQKLLALGARVIGKTNMDEFAMGSSTDTSGIKQTNNPWDTSRVAGGSSGGSAAAVASGMVPFALGSDTSGSVRQPAAFCGVVGLKPGFGAVSRYGLAAYGSSIEGIGIIADSVARARAVFAAIRGKDPLDHGSKNAPQNAPPLFTPKDKAVQPSSQTIGFISEAAMAEALIVHGNKAAVMEDEVLRAYDNAKKAFADLGYKLVEVTVPGLRYAAPACFTISTAEGSSNMARFDGICFGKQAPHAENPDDLVDKSRDIGFGDETKLRILLGTYALRSGLADRYYFRALRIQAAVKAALEQLFANSCDALLLPVYPTRAFGRDPAAASSYARKVSGVFDCVASLAGLPAAAFPSGKVGGLEGGLPAGVQLVGRPFAEGTILDMAEAYEAAYPFAHPESFKAFW
jgi:aspartyl-tRNA(Asn)/glutamyl-tRNA(Gln) amidotransferase subunit A